MIYPCSRSPYSRKFAASSHPHIGYDYVYPDIEFTSQFTGQVVTELQPAAIEVAANYTPDVPITALQPLVTFSAAYALIDPTTIISPAVIAFSATYTPQSPITTLIPAVIAFGCEYGPFEVFLKEFLALELMPVKQISVSKSVDDQSWALSATLVGYHELNLINFKHITYETTDHNGTEVAIFSGILPKTSPEIQECANQTTLTGVDYAWFLGQQYVPSEWQHNTKTVNPADIITGLLGGEDYLTTTGINPYQIDDVTEWGDTLNSKVFDFEATTTKWQAIQKICKYTRYIFLIKWVEINEVIMPCAYFVSRDNLDTRAGLPAALTITAPDDYLTGKIKIEIKGDERYNKITVIGRDNTGGTFSSSLSSAAVTNGDELPVEFVENSGSWTTQDQVDERCQELYDYYAIPANTYNASFNDRMDLELLQLIKFIGYDGVEEEWMRITKITKSISASGNSVQKRVDITFTLDEKWKAVQSMYRSSESDLSSETETIVTNIVTSLGTTQVGTVESIDGTDVEVLCEDGTTQTTRGIS